MEALLEKIRDCKACSEHLPLGPRPIVAANPKARILIIGHAPGTKVHQTGIPWDDQSGKQLRKWMDVTDEEFYDETQIAQMPMGFCYPGKGKSGDLPPRPECAPLWHQSLLEKMPNLKLTLLIGQHSQRYYLGNERQKNLTETVKNYKAYLPQYFVLPHPSPRNRFWLGKNPWFGEEVLPELKDIIAHHLRTEA
ncbi:uracil-DNA glycosylase family protein [Flagellimonas aequoris]|uniref:Uracil-DNA glycosylase family protein n=1 Tax=Flagellimonas aequoris TaxID=2306997 RepID=A0A418N5Q3_9FLAO|nr:uracil-DNA glycosylase family protein [Allomuricauda aequoris]RIV69564.1 uracil-DNA glycosylase family protein [Allomuricauda aequoris]TXK01142.1 uracil-DNA glycosylase family protein [Allomuricauda aequoris]